LFRPNQFKNLFRLFERRGMARGGDGLLSATIGSLVLRILGMLASLALGVQLARGLSPEGLGEYGVAVALALMLSVLGQFGLPTVATREISVAFAQRRWGAVGALVLLFTRIVAANSVLLAFLWIFASVAVPKLAGPTTMTFGAALLVPFFAVTVLVSAYLRAMDRLIVGQSLEILVRPVLMCVLLALVAYLGAQLTSPIAIWLNVATSAATLLAAAILLRRLLPRSSGERSTIPSQPWFGAAAALAGFDALKQLDATYGILLLGALSSHSEAGYFRVALSIVVIVATPLSIFNVVLAPTLARLFSKDDRHRLQQVMATSAVLMTAITFILLAAIVVAGRPLISLIFGRDFEPAWLPLVLLTCAQLVNALFGVGWVLLSMSGGERRLTLSYSTSVAVSVAAAVPLISVAGARGAAAAALIGALIQNLFAWHGVRARTGLESSVVAIFSQLRPDLRSNFGNIAPKRGSTSE
jgi:O-antigen/teichoic acid export membrane protein